MIQKRTSEEHNIKQQSRETETFERETVLHLLQALQNKDDFPGLLEQITFLAQAWSDCRAAGIRLGREGTYPFFSTRGFSTQFLENESLCSIFSGKWPPDSGRKENEPEVCLCRRALAGSLGENSSNMPEDKSLWTNCLQTMQHPLSDNDCHMARQCRCQKEGYRSMALIPLLSGEKTIGFLQLNDPKPDRLNEQKIKHLEHLALILGPVIKERISVRTDEKQKTLPSISTSFQEKQKMESIGRLAGGIVHDVSNLLMPIRGHCELLAMDIAPESPEHNHIKEIMKAAQKAEDLTKKILSVSRRAESALGPVLLQETIKDVLKLIRSAAPCNVEILQEINERCAPVIADPTRLHQVIMNLVKNAIDAVKQAGGKVTITLDQSDTGPDNENGKKESDRYAVLKISDTGHGIEPDLLDKIFEPYFTTKKAENGTGLGLAAVYGIVRDYGGDVSVTSQPEEGTQFTIYLPCDCPAAHNG